MRIGIDLGGTKIEAVAMDSLGKITFRRRIPTPKDYASLVRALSDLALDSANQSGAPLRLGVGIPGSESPNSGLIRNANTIILNGKPLRRDLEAAFGGPVRLANDANCFAFSESADGAAKGAASVFGAILGTGCGGGVVIGGELILGANGIAGEWGHTPLPWPKANEYPGPHCWCGRRGCLETWISGAAFEDDYERAAGQRLGASEIAALAAAGDAASGAALDRLADRLARALATAANIIDPEIIVLGGGLSNVEALYPKVTALLPLHAFCDSYVPRVVKNLHGDSSGVRGAAWLWPEDAQP